LQAWTFEKVGLPALQIKKSGGNSTGSSMGF
jgi:hypothetical protein